MNPKDKIQQALDRLNILRSKNKNMHKHLSIERDHMQALFKVDSHLIASDDELRELTNLLREARDEVDE